MYLGHDPLTGKKRYVTQTVRGGKREAQTALAEMVTEAERGLTVPTTATVGELLLRRDAVAECWRRRAHCGRPPRTSQRCDDPQRGRPLPQADGPCRRRHHRRHHRTGGLRRMIWAFSDESERAATMLFVRDGMESSGGVAITGPRCLQVSV